MTELPVYGPETMTDEELEAELSFAIAFDGKHEAEQLWLKSLQDEVERRNS